MSTNDPIDESVLADFERAKEIATRSKSLDEITSHLVTGIVDGEKLHRHIYWAMLYYSLLNNQVVDEVRALSDCPGQNP